jgi:DNA-binding NarL/FixJ family response regulator
VSATTPVVLVVDDHALVSTTLVIALNGRGLAAHRCEDGAPEAVQRTAAALEPGVALVDMDLGSGPAGEILSGVDLVPLLLEMGWRVVMLTGNAPESDVAAAITAGAVGWLHKLAPFEELLEAVLDVVAGRQVLGENERLRLVRLHHAEQTRQRVRRAGFDQLTSREWEVLHALAAGRRAAAIAEESVVSLATVRAQIRSVLAKLGVSSQLEAVALLRELDDS